MYYLNTNTQFILFQDTLNSHIYVDKSLLIKKISPLIRTDGKYICITRPRRFGKTVNANMLGAYYCKAHNSHVLFDHLTIAGEKIYEDYINRYNVIHIDFSVFPDFCDSYDTYLKGITNPHFKWGFEKRPQGLCYCSPERWVSQAFTTCYR